MTFGRPPAIPESYVRTPLPQLSDQTIGHHNGDDVMLSTGFFVHTM